MAVDLTAGFRTHDHDAMIRMTHRMTSAPWVRLVVYDLGPMLVLAGLVGLLAIAAARRRITPLPPSLVFLGFVTIALAQVLTPLGVALIWAGLAAAERPRRRVSPRVSGG
jgi:hypothetical protein